MKAIAAQMSLFVAGFLNGLNFFNYDRRVDKVSTAMRSIKLTKDLSFENGQQKDSENLFRDWVKVRQDLMNAFKESENELTGKSA